MKIFKFVTLLIVLFIGVYGFKLYQGYHTPPHYRTTDQVPTPYRYAQGFFRGYTFRDKGLSNLDSIASGYLDFRQFRSLVKNCKGSIVVLNGLADEVYYVNDKNLKFFCLKYKNGHLRSKNRGLAKNLVCRTRQLASGLINPLEIKVSQLETESQLLSQYGIEYRTPLPTNWLSDWGFMDELVSFFDSLKSNTTLYFHCGHGQGRTTTLLTLWDVYNNSQHLPVNDIIARQYMLGGEDLMDVEEWEDGSWTAPHLLSRRNLILAFYTYMNDKEGHGHRQWSEWLESKPMGPDILELSTYL